MHVLSITSVNSNCFFHSKCWISKMFVDNSGVPYPSASGSSTCHPCSDASGPHLTHLFLTDELTLCSLELLDEPLWYGGESQICFHMFSPSPGGHFVSCSMSVSHRASSETPPLNYLNHISLASVATAFPNFLFCHSIICLTFHIPFHYCNLISQFFFLLYQLVFFCFNFATASSSSLDLQVSFLDPSPKERMKILRSPPTNCYTSHPCCCLFWVSSALLARVIFPLVLPVTVFHKKLNVCSRRQ